MYVGRGIKSGVVGTQPEPEAAQVTVFVSVLRLQLAHKTSSPETTPLIGVPDSHTPYQSAQASMDSRAAWAAPSPSVATVGAALLPGGSGLLRTVFQVAFALNHMLLHTEPGSGPALAMPHHTCGWPHLHH